MCTGSARYPARACLPVLQVLGLAGAGGRRRLSTGRIIGASPVLVISNHSLCLLCLSLDDSVHLWQLPLLTSFPLGTFGLGHTPPPPAPCICPDAPPIPSVAHSWPPSLSFRIDSC